MMGYPFIRYIFVATLLPRLVEGEIAVNERATNTHRTAPSGCKCAVQAPVIE